MVVKHKFFMTSWFKLTLGTFLSLFLFFNFRPAAVKAQTSGASLFFNPSSLELEASQSASVQLEFDTANTPVTAVDVVADFKQSHLLINGITPDKTAFGTFVPLNSSETEFDWQKAVQPAASLIEFGALAFNWQSKTPTAAFNGKAKLATFNVQAKPVRRDKTMGSINLLMTAAKTTDSNLLDSEGNDILRTVIPLTVKVRAEPVCRAALGTDATVALDDLMLIINKGWGANCSGCPEDLDESGKIDMADLMMVVNYWGRTCTATE
jgi:hypothetical protein